MILLFFGPPGAGKGTQAKIVSDKFNIKHLSTGDILREKLVDKSELSNKLINIIDNGQLVSDSIINDLVSERINKEDCKNGFVLDGYPRTMEQGIFLENYFKKNSLKLDYIIDFTIDNKSIVKRIKARSLIEKRKDDNESVIETRIKKYEEETKPLSAYYMKNYKKKYYNINANQEIEKINEELIKKLENY